MKSFLSRLAVCSWSLRPESPVDLVEKLRAVGLVRVQLDLDPFREQPAAWADAQSVFAQAGVQPVSGMFRTVGEDYTTPATIRATGGLVPDGTWEANWRNLPATIQAAKQFGLDFVTFHAGFLPHVGEKGDSPHEERGTVPFFPADPTLGKLLERIRKVARLFAAAGITLGMETGQESGPALKAFLEKLGEPNVAVNFDPANMILYNNGDPIEALRLVRPWVRGCHLKDATATRVPGAWGEELCVGAGQVDWPAFFRAAKEIGFRGDFCFEREAGERRVEDIRAGRLFVERLLATEALLPSPFGRGAGGEGSERAS